ncbi:hypothetical protein OH77DRAFT_1440449 [Trametes cingulata]|nr:hypothetical protein OH77DRAFT_1440449 [Trametes cingulata]
MPQRAPLLAGQQWPRTQPHGPPITPPPPAQLASETGKLPSPPQLGWSKGRDTGYAEEVSELPAYTKNGTETEPTTPTATNKTGVTQEELTQETFMALVAHQQALNNMIGSAQSGLDAFVLSENEDADEAPNDATQTHHRTAPAVKNGDNGDYGTMAAKPARKRQRVESEAGQHAGAETRRVSTTTAAQMAHLDANALTGSPAGAERLPPLEKHHPDEALPPYGLLPPPPFPSPPMMRGRESERDEHKYPTYEEKGKAREDDWRPEQPLPTAPNAMVQVSVEELESLRAIARMRVEEMDVDANRAVCGTDERGGAGGGTNIDGTDTRSNEATSGSAVERDSTRRPCGHTAPPRPRATRALQAATPAIPLPPSGYNGDSSPEALEFPIRVDWSDPEDVKRIQELLRYTIERSGWRRPPQEDHQTAMDVDTPQDQTQAGAHPVATWRTTEGTTGGAQPRANSSQTDPSPQAGGHDETSRTAATALPLARERATQIESLGLSQAPTGGFPAVHARSPSDRLRGIPPAAKEEFRRQQRGTTAVLEVYGGKNFNYETAAMVTPDIERVIKTATGLEGFVLTPPPRCSPTTEPSEVPTAWLLTNLTPAATEYLAAQHAFATSDTAFFVYDKPEAIPTYLFALKGFNQSDAATAIAIVKEEFRREPLYNMVKGLVEANPELKEDPDATDNLIDTIKVVLRRRGGERAPAIGHVYMDSPTLAADQWVAWIDGIKEHGFSRAFYLCELADTNFRCDRCHGADHHTDQCAYAHLGDWHGTYVEPPAQAPTITPTNTADWTGNAEDANQAGGGRGGRGGGRGALRGYQGGGNNRRGYGDRGRGGRRFVGAPRARGG